MIGSSIKVSTLPLLCYFNVSFSLNKLRLKDLSHYSTRWFGYAW